MLLTAYLMWKRSAWGVFAASFWLLLAPSSGAVAIQDLMMEHRFYAPLMLITLAMVVGVWQCIRYCAARGDWPGGWTATMAAAACLAAASVLALRTHARNEDYRSEIALWEADLQVAPQNPRLCANLGKLYWQQGDHKKGLNPCLDALRLSPGTIAEHAHQFELNWLLARMYRDLGQPDEAIAHFRAALSGAIADEEKIAVGLELATGLDVTGRPAEAEQVFGELLALQHEHPQLYCTYEQYMDQHGRRLEAVAHWRKAQALAPDDLALQADAQRRLAAAGSL